AMVGRPGRCAVSAAALPCGSGRTPNLPKAAVRPAAAPAAGGAAAAASAAVAEPPGAGGRGADAGPAGAAAASGAGSAELARAPGRSALADSPAMCRFLSDGGRPPGVLRPVSGRSAWTLQG